MQATATSRARQICRMRSSLNRPSRSTRCAWGAPSIESRLTAETRNTGSSPGSSTISLGKPLIVVVHGATIAVASRSNALSRNSTTTGRLPNSGDSSHQTSPHRGRTVVTARTDPRQGSRDPACLATLPAQTTPSRPKHRACSWECGRTPRKQRRSRPAGDDRQVLPRLPRSSLRRRASLASHEPDREDLHRPSCLLAASCHKRSICMPHARRLNLLTAQRQRRSIGRCFGMLRGQGCGAGT